MKFKSNQPKDSAEQVTKNIRRATRRHYTSEDKIRMVLSGLRGKAALLKCDARRVLRRALNTAGARGVSRSGQEALGWGPAPRGATSDEVLAMRSQTQALKEFATPLESQILKLFDRLVPFLRSAARAFRVVRYDHALVAPFCLCAPGLICRLLEL